MTDADDRLSAIESTVSPVALAHGLSLVDLDFRREGRRWVLRLFVDKPGGVGIGDCQRLSRELGDVLDVAGLIEESYDLEVSSPGLDRELRKEREFRWAIGKPIRCWVREPVEGQREVRRIARRVVGRARDGVRPRRATDRAAARTGDEGAARSPALRGGAAVSGSGS